MRDVATSWKNKELHGSRYPLIYKLRKSHRPEFVLITMYHQYRTFHLPNKRFETPVRKVRGKPNLSPGIQDPLGLMTVPFAKLFELSRVFKLLLSLPDSGKGPVFNESLGGFGYYRLALIRIQSRNKHRHRPADAMPEKHIFRQSQGTSEQRKVYLRFFSNKVYPGQSVSLDRLTKAQSIVGDNRTPETLGQQFRKLTPQADTAERVMQENHRDFIRNYTGKPCSDKDTAARYINRNVCCFNS